MKISEEFNKEKIGADELILNSDGSLYHTCLKNEFVADDVIVVGDQNRVDRISSRFDKVEHKVRSREFCTHTGTLNNKRISVISTGIGVDNIDIVMNEIDAAVNIDLKTGIPKEKTRSLNIIRLGTTGSLREEIEVGDFIASRFAFGYDGLPWFYQPEFTERELDCLASFKTSVKWDSKLARPYFVECSDELMEKIGSGMHEGITATANGFYGPQGRTLRLPLAFPGMHEELRNFYWEGLRITNFEMESSGLYALAGMLGHNVLTVCVVLANRYTNSFAKDHNTCVDSLIEEVFKRLTK